MHTEKTTMGSIPMPSLVIGNWKDPTRLFKNENTALRFVEESGNTQQRDLNGALALVHLRRA
jgi:hypothetical protein